MSPKQPIHVPKTAYPCPKNSLSMSQKQLIHVPKTAYPCPKNSLSMSQKQPIHVPKTAYPCPKTDCPLNSPIIHKIVSGMLPGIHSQPPGSLLKSTGLSVDCYQESTACPPDLCPNPQDCLWNATRNPQPAPWISAQIHRVVCGMLPGIHSLHPGALPNSTGRSL